MIDKIPTNCPLCGKILQIDNCDKRNTKKHKRENIVWCQSSWKDFGYHYAYYYNVDDDQPFVDEVIKTGDYILTRSFFNSYFYSKIEKYRFSKTTRSRSVIFSSYELIEILTHPEDFENFLILR